MAPLRVAMEFFEDRMKKRTYIASSFWADGVLRLRELAYSAMFCCPESKKLPTLLRVGKNH
jgi:hypothetical protein